MIYPSADRLEEKVGNKYALVIVAAKRARQLKEGAMPLGRVSSENPLTISLDEIGDEHVVALAPPEPVEREALLPAEPTAASLLASIGDEFALDDEEVEETEETAEEPEAEAEPVLAVAQEESEEEEEEEEEESGDDEAEQEEQAEEEE